ncbi:hypothetical protein AVEN_185782-1 [Araneus ventricosus]|uniref:RNA-directed DNA polymerase n=1 Tax=Araneus ventricosus TaxID=182803 RepID=A0A4Y2HIP4_ARAVE|nr:hypothetical protein AVEN_185782-1 [Araneus ventricosus]
MFTFQQRNEKASPRQLRHLQYISEFSTDIRHIGGKENIVADSLSRIELISEIDYDKIADAHIGNKDLNELRSKPSLHFKQYPLDSGKILWCDISTTKIRRFVPQDFRMHIFQKFHNLSHPGVKSTVKQTASRFTWLNIRKDINQWAKYCIHCQKNKFNRHTRAQISTYKEVDDRFSVIYIDIIGSFPTSEGKTYCLTCIDRFTCWIEVISLANLMAETVAREFWDHWISRFGMPYRVITDQGSQFRSELFKNIGVICGFKVCTTTAYHPQCNGEIERLRSEHTILLNGPKPYQQFSWDKDQLCVEINEIDEWRQKRETRRAKRLLGRLAVNQVEGIARSFAIIAVGDIIIWDFGNFGVCNRGERLIKFGGELVNKLFKGGNVKGMSDFVCSLIPVCTGYHPDGFVFECLKFIKVGFGSAGPDWACIGDNWTKIGKANEQFVVN